MKISFLSSHVKEIALYILSIYLYNKIKYLRSSLQRALNFFFKLFRDIMLCVRTSYVCVSGKKKKGKKKKGKMKARKTDRWIAVCRQTAESFPSFYFVLPKIMPVRCRSKLKRVQKTFASTRYRIEIA